MQRAYFFGLRYLFEAIYTCYRNVMVSLSNHGLWRLRSIFLHKSKVSFDKLRMTGKRKAKGKRQIVKM